VLTLLEDWASRPASGSFPSTRWCGSQGGHPREVFGTGTAAVISPVGELAYKGQRMVINGGRTAPLTQKLYDAIVASSTRRSRIP